MGYFRSLLLALHLGKCIIIKSDVTMYDEALLHSMKLSPFVSGYFLVTLENQEEKINLSSYKGGFSLGIPLGKPFYFYAGTELGEFEDIPYTLFDKPMVLLNYKSIESIKFKGDARAVIIEFTDLGLQLLMEGINQDFQEPVFPIGRLGLPIFNLITRRKLRLNQDNHIGILLIEGELMRYFKKYDLEESPMTNLDLNQEHPTTS